MASGRGKARDDKVVPLRPARACPICGKESQRDFYPFCSRRCADIDLNRWLSGSYAIPAVEDETREGGEDDEAP
jgi:endogenous inhibitor of DNA gyrase (YacG/DUF329 family)